MKICMLSTLSGSKLRSTAFRFSKLRTSSPGFRRVLTTDWSRLDLEIGDQSLLVDCAGALEGDTPPPMRFRSRFAAARRGDRSLLRIEGHWQLSRPQGRRGPFSGCGSIGRLRRRSGTASVAARRGWSRWGLPTCRPLGRRAWTSRIKISHSSIEPASRSWNGWACTAWPPSTTTSPCTGSVHGALEPSKSCGRARDTRSSPVWASSPAGSPHGRGLWVGRADAGQHRLRESDYHPAPDALRSVPGRPDSSTAWTNMVDPQYHGSR